MSHSLRPHGLQHFSLLCPPLSPGVCSDSCPLNWWCYLTILSSATLLHLCLQSFPASGSFPMRRLFALGGQSIGDSASVLPMNVQVKLYSGEIILFILLLFKLMPLRRRMFANFFSYLADATMKEFQYT